MTLLKKLSNNQQSNSLATQLRRKRFALFESLVATLPLPIKILDIGGTSNFWERMGFVDKKGIEIVLFNLSQVEVHYPNFISVGGDASKKLEFKDKEFDIVFSNSVIEHVGGFESQQIMAEEVKRIGKKYFVQTPNRYFPIEPHFLFPYFLFLPQWLRIWLVMHFKMGWYPKIRTKKDAIKIVNSIHLLSLKKFKAFFPVATIYKERFLGVTKSFIAYGGWDKKRK